MTDREAIRRLAGVVYRLTRVTSERIVIPHEARSWLYAETERLAERLRTKPADLAEPAAPTDDLLKTHTSCGKCGEWFPLEARHACATTDEYKRGYSAGYKQGVMDHDVYGVKLDDDTPATPTVTATCTDCGKPVTHSCAGPTVTREQAEKLVSMIRSYPAAEMGSFGTPIRVCDGFRLVTGDYQDDLPAFFRAVADKLDREG